MDFLGHVKLYFITLAAFLVIDLVWLGWLARDFYQKYLGDLMSPNVNWAAAILFYLLFVAGLIVFVVSPGLQTGSLARTILLGAFFGLVTYATYELTNLATLKSWPLFLTVVDLAWGVILSSLVSWISYLAGRALA
jgi:uncharacterized membrane protein